MPESRGAASVTLDTAVEAAIHFLPQLATWRDEDVRALARAVTDALLAKGRSVQMTDCGRGWDVDHPGAFVRGHIDHGDCNPLPGIWLPLEAS